jgi:hypothetical protein
MATRGDWDYALVLKGVTPEKLPMAKLAEYLRDWAALLGEGNAPVFRGISKGSVLLKVKVPDLRRTEARVRLLEAKSKPDASAASYVEGLNRKMRRDALSGSIITRAGDVVIELNAAPVAPGDREYTVTDQGTIDGVVVGIAGTDDTVHLRIQEASGAVWSIALRDFAMARQLASHFRADPLRVLVHGTWKRSPAGVWEPLNLYADGFELLDNRSAKVIMEELRAIPGNGWAALSDPQAVWKELRGIE